MKRVRMVTTHQGPVSMDQVTRLTMDPAEWSKIAQSLRQDADKRAAEVGGYVDPDVAPTFVNPQVKQHHVFGGDWLLWAAEWTVLVPDSFDEVEESRRDEKIWKNND